MKLNFKAKDNITERYEISDFQNDFTVVHDKNYSLIYFIAYQQFKSLNIKKIMKPNYYHAPDKLSMNYKILKENSLHYSWSIDIRANVFLQDYGIKGAFVFALIGIFFLAATGFVVVGIIFLVLAILGLVAFFFGSKNRKFFSVVTKYSSVKKMRNETMQRLWVTPLMFENTEESHVIQNVSDVPNTLGSINDIPINKLKDYFDFLTLDEQKLAEAKKNENSLTKKIIV